LIEANGGVLEFRGDGIRRYWGGRLSNGAQGGFALRVRLLTQWLLMDMARSRAVCSVKLR